MRPNSEQRIHRRGQLSALLFHLQLTLHLLGDVVVDADHPHWHAVTAVSGAAAGLDVMDRAAQARQTDHHWTCAPMR
ncbi:MAG: hypothetical protein VKM17_00695 [Cyanobacteriota bacterium]|nr:hypothetical protein [Cyanobacteriota bacterium]